MKCPRCGNDLPDDSNYCSRCGSRVFPLSQDNDFSSDSTQDSNTDPETDWRQDLTFSDAIKERCLRFWYSRSLFGKASLIALALFALFLLIALLWREPFAEAVAILQLAAIIVSLLVHRHVVQWGEDLPWIKYLTFAIAIFLIPFYFTSYSWDTHARHQSASVSTDASSPISTAASIETPAPSASNEQTATEETSLAADTNIEKGSEYAYMSDTYNVYIATAVSNSVIKVERWEKHSASDEKLEYDSDIGVYKTTDSTSGFEWIDKDHTTFRLSIQDEENSRLEHQQSVLFTINVNSSDINKGTNCNEHIRTYAYTNDDFHLYRAIALTDSLFKVEAWYRPDTDNDFLYAYDVCLIDLNSNDNDFEWTDDEHTSFLVTMQDQENDYYWERSSLTLFVEEDQDSPPEYNTVLEYLNSRKVGEGEAAVPDSATSYLFEDYREVQSELSAAGFTNFSYSILYDIIFGITPEGEVDSVTIDGNSDFEAGDVYPNDVPIVITYHMKMEDAPERQDEDATSSSSITSSTPIPSASIQEEILTPENCPDLAALLQLSDPEDPSVSAFATTYSGRTIAFDGCILDMQHHGNYSTRFDVLIGANDYDLYRAYGPNFHLTNVNYYDMNVSGSDSVYAGLNVHIVAKVEDYDAITTLFELDIVSMTAR